MENIMNSTQKIREMDTVIKKLKKELKREKFNNEVLQQQLDWYKKEYPVEVEIVKEEEPTVDEIDEIHNHISLQNQLGPLATLGDEETDRFLETLDKVSNMINRKNEVPGCACIGGTDCDECADCIDE